MTTRPFPVAPLVRALGLDPDDPQLTSKLVTQLGLTRSWVIQCRAKGLSLRQADEWAHRAGLNPGEIWARWWDLSLRGIALVNAHRETCRHGHPLVRINSRGFRTCVECPAAAARRYRAKKLANTQVTRHMTQEAS